MRRQFIIAQNILINRRGTICGDVCANTAKANMTFRAELLLRLYHLTHQFGCYWKKLGKQPFSSTKKLQIMR